MEDRPAAPRTGSPPGRTSPTRRGPAWTGRGRAPGRRPGPARPGSPRRGSGRPHPGRSACAPRPGRAARSTGLPAAWVDRDRAAQGADRGQHLPRHLPDGPVRGQRDAFRRPGAVLDHRLVPVQVQRGDQRAGTVRCGQRRGFPAARGQPQGRVLQLGFGWRELHRQLAEDLGVRVQRVAGRAPPIVRNRRPPGHLRTVAKNPLRFLGGASVVGSGRPVPTGGEVRADGRTVPVAARAAPRGGGVRGRGGIRTLGTRRHRSLAGTPIRPLSHPSRWNGSRGSHPHRPHRARRDRHRPGRAQLTRACVRQRSITRASPETVTSPAGSRFQSSR